MADRILEQALSGRVTDIPRSWVGTGALVVELADASFLPGTAARLTIECSWDGGLTWTYQIEQAWSGGSKGTKDGGSPRIELGPFQRGTRANPLGEVVNPTHYRLSIEPTLGTPVIGVR